MGRGWTVFFLCWILLFALPAYNTDAQTAADSTEKTADANPQAAADPAPDATVESHEPSAPAAESADRDISADTVPSPQEPNPAPATDPSTDTSKSLPEPDRRWIIKGKSPQKSAPRGVQIPEKKMAWENPQQQKACTGYRDHLEDSYRKAQYYSIQGDACVTAEQSKRFLDLVDKCRDECPPDFLDHYGFKPELVRNLNVLKRLGEKHCLKR